MCLEVKISILFDKWRFSREEPWGGHGPRGPGERWSRDSFPELLFTQEGVQSIITSWVEECWPPGQL